VAVGTVVPLVKNALVELIADQYPSSVTYQSPTQMSELLGEDGSGLGIWWLDDGTDITWNLNVVQKPLRFDETATIVLVIQSLGVDTDDTQLALDTQCAEVLATVIGFCASDPSLAIPWTADYSNIVVTPQTGRMPTGVDSQNQRGSRIELTLNVTALLVLDAP
jgi:hypothetical protein